MTVKTCDLLNLINFGKENKMHLIIQGPVWQSEFYLPEWFRQITDVNEIIRIYNEATLMAVQNCGEGYNIYLEVVNEPVRGLTIDKIPQWRYFMEGNRYVKNPPFIIQENDLRWIEEPLHTARNANQNIKLFISQFSLEFDGATEDQFYPLVQKLIQDNTPLDGICFQGHVNADEILTDVEGKMLQFKANIKKYQDLGLVVSCPELEVVPRGSNTETVDYLYYRMVKTLLEAGAKKIGIWTDDPNKGGSVHPYVLQPSKYNRTDIRNTTYAWVAKASEEYYLQNQ